MCLDGCVLIVCAVCNVVGACCVIVCVCRLTCYVFVFVCVAFSFFVICVIVVICVYIQSDIVCVLLFRVSCLGVCCVCFVARAFDGRFCDFEFCV